MRLGNRSGNRQAQARARSRAAIRTFCPCIGLVHAKEALEYVRLGVRRDTRPVVGDLDTVVAVAALHV